MFENYISLYQAAIGEEDPSRFFGLFFLFLGRILPIIGLAPFFGAKVLPHPVKMALAISLFAIFLPQLLFLTTTPLGFNITLITYFLKELLVGVILGYFVTIPFIIVQNAGIMIDSWHFFRSGSSLDDLAACPGALIHSIQLNDALAAPEADLNAGMMRRLLPGEGELNLKGLMQALAATGTTAPIGIETFSPELDAMGAEGAITRCATALEHCLELAK